MITLKPQEAGVRQNREDKDTRALSWKKAPKRNAGCEAQVVRVAGLGVSRRVEGLGIEDLFFVKHP